MENVILFAEFCLKQLELFYVWKIVFFALGINISAKKLKFADKCDAIYFRNTRISREFSGINFFYMISWKPFQKKLEEEINVG